MVTKVSDTVVDTVGERQFKYDPDTTTGLTFGYQAGKLYEHTTQSVVDYPAGTLSLTDNAANYIVLNLDNDPATLEAATALPELNILIYIVTTASGVITNIEDWRWKTVNNRLLVTPFWSTNEPEYFLLKPTSNAAYYNSETLIRGDLTDPSTVRLYNLNDTGAETIGGVQSTSNEWAVGYRKIYRPGDFKYLIGQYSINNGDEYGFKAFKRAASDAKGYTWEWLTDSAVDALVDNSSVATGNQQLWGAMYNPVYDEIIVSGGSYDWVYDDNDDDTFTINIPNDSFSHSLNVSSGWRQYPRIHFTPDGEQLLVKEGTTILNVYDRQTPPTTPRYNRVQSITLSGANATSPFMAMHPSGSEVTILDRNQYSNPAAPTTPTYGAYRVTNSSGTWTEAEDITRLIPNGNNQNEMANYMSSVHYSTDGDHLIVAAVGNATNGSGLFHLYKDVNGDWAFNSNMDETIFFDGWSAGDGCDIAMPLGDANDTWWIVINEYTVGKRAFFAQWTGATDTAPWTNVYEVTDFFRLSGTATPDDLGLATLVDPGVPQLISNGTNTNPYDAMFLKHDPYWYWSAERAETATYHNGVGRMITEQGNSNLFVVNASTSADFQAAGPLANSYAIDCGADLELRDSSFDACNYLTSAAGGGAGTMVLLFKTWAALPDISDDTTLVPYHRPIFSYGAGFWHTTQDSITFGLKSDGSSNTYFCWGWSTDNDTSNASMWVSDSALSLDTWYMAHVTVFNDGREPVVYLNATETAMTDQGVNPMASHRWFSSVDNTKFAYIGRSNSAYDRDITDIKIAALGYYDSPLTEENVAQMVADAGL